MSEEKPKFRLIKRDEDIQEPLVEMPKADPIEHTYQKSYINQALNQDRPELKFKQDPLLEKEPEPVPVAPIRLQRVPDDVNLLKEAMDGYIRPILGIICFFDLALLLTLFQPFDAIKASWSTLSWCSTLLCLGTLLAYVGSWSRARSKDIPAGVRANRNRIKCMFVFLLLTIFIAWMGYRPGDTATPQERVDKLNFFKWILKADNSEQN